MSAPHLNDLVAPLIKCLKDNLVSSKSKLIRKALLKKCDHQKYKILHIISSFQKIIEKTSDSLGSNPVAVTYFTSIYAFLFQYIIFFCPL